MGWFNFINDSKKSNGDPCVPKKHLHVPPWISPKSPDSLHEIPILLVKSPFFIMKSPILVGQRSASKGSKRHLRHIVGLQLCEFRCLSSSTAAPGLNNLGFRRNDGNGELNGDWSTQIRDFTGYIYIYRYIDIDIDIYVLMRYKPTNAMIFGLDTMWAPKSWVFVFGKWWRAWDFQQGNKG